MAKDNDVVLTPMMKQYFDLKAKHPDALMLFRCGDFYETYSEDAVTASQILGITLTKRANGQRAGEDGGDGWIPASCARHVLAQTYPCRKAGGYLRPVGRPEDYEEISEAGHYRAGDAGRGYQR